MKAFRSNPDAQAFARRHALYQWQLSPRRSALEARAESVLTAPLNECFGRWSLQVGGGASITASTAGTLRVAHCGLSADCGADLVVDSDRLPLASTSIDVIVLVFALEFAASPHRLIREAYRVLRERGTLMVVGQSASGAAAWLRLLGVTGRGLPMGARLVRPGRLQDWLTLLDFEVETPLGFAAGWPWHRHAPTGSAAERLFADCFAMVAHKRVLPLRPAATPRAVPVRPRVAGAAVGNLSGRVTRLRDKR